MKKVELEPLSEEKIDTTNEELIKIIEIEDSPFQIVKTEDKYFLAMGKYRLSEMFDTEKEAREDVKDLSWFRLLSVMHAVASEVIEHDKAVEKAKLNIKDNEDEQKEK